MKILCIGAGSMGRRRLRDLTYLGRTEVILCETSPERCHAMAEAFGIPGFTSLEEAFAQKPSAVTISVPPSLHSLPVRMAMERGLPVFAEVPFLLGRDELRDVAAAGSRALLAVSHSFRLYPPVRIIRDLLCAGAIGKPLYFEHSLGNHLAEWHPYEDYRGFYGASLKMGGAGTDMIVHDFIGIQWWMGKTRSVFARLAKVSDLEIEGPDLQDALLTFENGARGFFHNDIVERGTLGRHVRIAGERGTIEWHQNLPYVRLYEARSRHERQIPYTEAADWPEAAEASDQVREAQQRVQAVSGAVPSSTAGTFTYESCYLREMKHFLDAIEGVARYRGASLAEELHNVELYHALLESATSAREVEVPA